MSRYSFLDKQSIYEITNKLRDAFLSAKNGDEVEYIINGLLTSDEKYKLGRRILIAECLQNGMIIEDIVEELNVGSATVLAVSRIIEQNPQCFDLINKRGQKVEKEFQKKKYETPSGSNLIHKKKNYTGYKRKDVGR